MERVTIPDAAMAMLRRSATAVQPPSPYDDFETFLAGVYSIIPALPPSLLRKLVKFGNDPHEYGALLVSNFPIDENLPTTPLDGKPSKEKQTFVSEACALAVSVLLGQPFGYHDEKDGDIIHSLSPVRTEAQATSNESSDIELGFHTDFNFDKNHPERPYNVHNPDYIVLLCLRGDRHGEAYTRYADARDIVRQLSPAQLETVRAPRYQFCASYSFTRCDEERAWSVPSPLIIGPDEFPEVSIDLMCGLRAVDEEAGAAIHALREVCERPDVSTRVCLRPGDLLVIDNRKGAHSRTAFTAYFDGQDRWLHRVYVRRSLFELRSPSNAALRVF
jgi:L-asparagine oxygenase